MPEQIKGNSVDEYVNEFLEIILAMADPPTLPKTRGVCLHHRWTDFEPDSCKERCLRCGEVTVY